MSDRFDSDERWQPPVGPVDPDHPECAAVIAEVWTLLDGECTPETRDKLLKYGSGSQWEVDASTAAAMILVGAAVRMPSPVERLPVLGVNGMSMITRESA